MLSFEAELLDLSMKKSAPDKRINTDYRQPYSHWNVVYPSTEEALDLSLPRNSHPYSPCSSSQSSVNKPVWIYMHLLLFGDKCDSFNTALRTFDHVWNVFTGEATEKKIDDSEFNVEINEEGLRRPSYTESPSERYYLVNLGIFVLVHLFHG